jgi:uncharacterized membrane protein (DUF106 family)
LSPINASLRALFDALLWPFRSLPPIVGLAVVSLLVAVGMLLVFRATSNQRRLEEVKRAIMAGLLEVRLFNDDFGAVLRAQGEILRQNLRYLGLSLVPMAWMLVPFILITAQLQFHYGYEGLTPGEPALVKVQLKPEALNSIPADGPSVTLEVPAGLRVETPAVWAPALGELAWRIAAEQPGTYELVVTVAGTPVTKQVVVSEQVIRRSPIRVARSVLDELLYPAEPPLDASVPLRSIEVTYPSRAIEIAGVEMPWLVAFILLSMAFAFLLRGRFGVTF